MAGSPLAPIGNEVVAVGGLITVSRGGRGGTTAFFSEGEVNEIASLAVGEVLSFMVPEPNGERELMIRFDGCRSGVSGPESVYSRWYSDAPDDVSQVSISHADGWWTSREGGDNQFTRD